MQRSESRERLGVRAVLCRFCQDELTPAHYNGYLIPMPNAISPDKRSVTFLESRKVLDWMEEIARARKTDLSVILREATSA